MKEELTLDMDPDPNRHLALYCAEFTEPGGFTD